MKIRNDFVTNSSSSSFIITNLSNENKSIKDLILENEWLLYDDESDNIAEALLHDNLTNNLLYKKIHQSQNFAWEFCKDYH